MAKKKTMQRFHRNLDQNLNQNYAIGHFRSPASFAHGFESDQLGRI